MLWKIPLGYGILKSCNPNGYWNFSFFYIIELYGHEKFQSGIDPRIQKAQMAVLENI